MAGNAYDEPFTTGDLVYEFMLWPFLKSAWQEIDGSAGLPGRLVQIEKVYDHAEAERRSLSGRTRRLPRRIDLNAFRDV